MKSVNRTEPVDSYREAFSQCAIDAWKDTIDNTKLDDEEEKSLEKQAYLKKKACVWDKKTYEEVFITGHKPPEVVKKTVISILRECDLDSVRMIGRIISYR